MNNHLENFDSAEDNEVFDFQGPKFISTGVLLLDKSEKLLGDEEILLINKQTLTPPRAPRLRPQPVPIKFNYKEPMRLPDSSFNANNASATYQKPIPLLDNQFENMSLSTTYLDSFQEGDDQKSYEINSFLAKPISTYLRNRYESIEIVDLSEISDLSLSVSEEFDMRNFLGYSNIPLENQQQLMASYQRHQ